MNKLIEKTGISFSAGEKISAAKLNVLNNKINELVDIVNSTILQADFNVNKELGDMTNTYTLAQAIAVVPVERRALGLQIRFLEDNNGTPGWINYTYIGETLAEFSSEKNWSTSDFDIIDGGEW